MASISISGQNLGSVPLRGDYSTNWIPACAGMTKSRGQACVIVLFTQTFSLRRAQSLLRRMKWGSQGWATCASFHLTAKCLLTPLRTTRKLTNRRLLEFSATHYDASGPLQAWRKAMEATDLSSFAELRKVFRSVDKVGELHVFNIAGNKYRLITFLHFDRQLCYIKQVLTHTEYDNGAWKK